MSIILRQTMEFRESNRANILVVTFYTDKSLTGRNEGIVMTGIFMESIVIAFMIGGIVGAVTALHLAHRKEPAEIENKRQVTRY